MRSPQRKVLGPVSYTHLDVYKRQHRLISPAFVGQCTSSRSRYVAVGGKKGHFRGDWSVYVRLATSRRNFSSTVLWVLVSRMRLTIYSPNTPPSTTKYPHLFINSIYPSILYIFSHIATVSLSILSVYITLIRNYNILFNSTSKLNLDWSTCPNKIIITQNLPSTIFYKSFKILNCLTLFPSFKLKSFNTLKSSYSNIGYLGNLQTIYKWHSTADQLIFLARWMALL